MTGEARPLHLLAGGPAMRSRRGPDPLLRTALAATGIERPTVAYIGAASRDNRLFFHLLAAWFRRAGAATVSLVRLASPRVDLRRARETLAAADLVFVSGGDVDAGMQILERRGMVPFLKELFAAGKPFAGVSAGSIMLGRGWGRWRDPDDDSSVTAFSCLGLAPVWCDTHAEAESWEELKVLLAINPDGTCGYGIPSGGALRVDPDGRVSALGLPASRFVRRGDRVVNDGTVEADPVG